MISSVLLMKSCGMKIMLSLTNLLNYKCSSHTSVLRRKRVSPRMLRTMCTRYITLLACTTPSTKPPLFSGGPYAPTRVDRPSKRVKRPPRVSAGVSACLSADSCQLQSTFILGIGVRRRASACEGVRLINARHVEVPATAHLC